MPAEFDAHDPGPDYQLVWPADLFRAEATALLDRGDRLSAGEAALLLEEAFAGETPRTDLTTATWPGMPLLIHPVGIGSAIAKDSHARAFLHHLAAVAEILPRWSEPRAYWTARRGQPALRRRPSTLFQDLPHSEPPPDDDWQRDLDALNQAQRLQDDWVGLVDDLLERGYLDRVAPRDCVDEPQPSPLLALNAETQDRIGFDDLWPLRPDPWDQALFHDLVEIVHDLVSRPRRRWFHSYQQCGHHYADFALAPGQALYRWRVNQLLARHKSDLRLAANGEDTGRLVHVAGDDRDDLVQRALVSPAPADRDAVAHAVALFRARAATREDKRSAVVALARVLEDRRRLLKAELLSRDEGALFQIANEFDVRHRGAKQRPGYDDAYLDWVFWWYLATVELSDRLIARQS